VGGTGGLGGVVGPGVGLAAGAEAAALGGGAAAPEGGPAGAAGPVPTGAVPAAGVGALPGSADAAASRFLIRSLRGTGFQANCTVKFMIQALMNLSVVSAGAPPAVPAPIGKLPGAMGRGDVVPAGG